MLRHFVELKFFMLKYNNGIKFMKENKSLSNTKQSHVATTYISRFDEDEFDSDGNSVDSYMADVISGDTTTYVSDDKYYDDYIIKVASSLRFDVIFDAGFLYTKGELKSSKKMNKKR